MISIVLRDLTNCDYGVQLALAKKSTFMTSEPEFKIFMNTKEVWPIMRLAGPVMTSRASAMLIITVDVAMCGFTSTEELAYYGIANAPHVSLLLIGIGSLLGIAILTARADGAAHYIHCGKIWRVGLVHAVVIGVVLGGLMQFGEEFFLLTGQSANLAEGGGRVLAMHGFGMAGLLCMIATSLFLEGLQRPIPAMVIVFCSNFVNAFLNWIFIFGNLGAPAMGAEGAALATNIVRWISFLALNIYIFRTIDRSKYGITKKFTRVHVLSKRLRKLGNPTAIAHGMESAAFAVVTLFAGYMGILETAAWTIAMNLITIAFMFALGFAMAASVRVANHRGQRHAENAVLAGWTAVTLGTAVLGVVSITLLSAPELSSRIFSHEPEVLVLAVPTLIAAAFILIPDGMQAIFVGVLRGYQDMWYITLTMISSFWVVMLPLAWLFGIQMQGGPVGLVWSVGVACIVALLMLVTRFRYLTSNRNF